MKIKYLFFVLYLLIQGKMFAQAFISEVQTINITDPLDGWIIRDWNANRTIHYGLKNGKDFLFLCDNQDFYLSNIGSTPTNYFLNGLQPDLY